MLAAFQKQKLIDDIPDEAVPSCNDNTAAMNAVTRFDETMRKSAVRQFNAFDASSAAIAAGVRCAVHQPFGQGGPAGHAGKR